MSKQLIPQSVNPNFVLIKPFPVEEPRGVLKMTEQSHAAEMRKQNRGEVIVVGSLVVPEGNPWIKPGNIVSFYKNAATEIKGEDEEVFCVVHQDHVMVNYK